MAEGRTAFPTDPDGWYVEPTAATLFLLERESFPGTILDPACGQGNVIAACDARRLVAVGSDKVDRVSKRTRGGAIMRPSWFLGVRDFLADDYPHAPFRRSVICNPPYGGAKLAEAFIRKALGLEGIKKAAFFVSSKFLFSDGRAAGLWAEHPPDRIYPVFPRPSCPPGHFLRAGGKAEGGVENFIWCVWSLAEPTGRTEFIWARPGGALLPREDAPRPR